ncbi:LysR family transcriptional regulator [Halobacteriovorax sp.]|uniref:LysR family transcriptional regulator n=1 Tax=Halobacteriovorax sp. TaxID=2020862 RepID=UPI003566B54B
MIRQNDINNFIEISNFPSLSLAAKKLEVTQPALSDSLKRLETDLGYKLFYRTKNGISLTPEGRTTLEKAKEIQNLLSNLNVQKESDLFPTINLGCHTTVGSYFLPKFFQLAAKEVPKYKVKLNHGLSRNIQSEIQSGKIDIGVVVNPLMSPDLIIRPLLRDTVHVWKAKKIAVQNQVIADTNLFQTQSIIKKWKKDFEDIIHTDGLELIARMTEQGCGYGIIPERVVKLLNSDLVKVANTPNFKDEFFIVYRPEFGKSNYEKKILELIYNSV